MRSHRAAFTTAAALLWAATGCSERIVGLTGWNCCGLGGGGSFTYPLTLSYVDNFLSGDSVRVSAWTSSGDPQSTWEITGPAVFVAGPDSIATQITSPVSDVWIRGSGSGAVSVKAVRWNKVDSTTTSFFVAAPSEVTLRIVQGRELNIRVGGEGWIATHLLGSQGRYYRGAFLWTSSDTTVVTLVDEVNHSPFVKVPRGRAVGTAKVVVSFREQRDTARVSVSP